MSKLNITFIVQSVTVILMAVMGFASCVQMDEPDTEAVGYLGFPQLGIDASIDNFAQTKALDFTVAEPSMDAVKFEVKSSNGTVVKTISGAWNTAVTLPVGSYTLEVTAGTEGFGDPYSSHVPLYKGTVAFNVGKLALSTPVVTLTVASSLVRLTVGEDLNGHFTAGSTVELSAGSTDATAQYGKWYYVPSGKALKASMSGTNSAGNASTFIYDLPSPAAKTAYDVICGKSATWPSIELEAAAFAGRIFIAPATVSNITDENKNKLVYEVSETEDFTSLKTVTAVSSNGLAAISDGISSGAEYYVRARIGNIYSNVVELTDGFSASAVKTAHFNDAGGNLAGTNAELNYNFPQGGLLEKLYDNGVLKLDASLMRSGVSNPVRIFSAPSGTMQEDTAGWPYLPQSADGSAYTLSLTHSLSGSNALTVTASGIPVAAPVFSVSLGASYSSYDKGVGFNGIAKNVGEANGLNSETIYNISASWTISAALLSNPNYAEGRSTKILLDKVALATPSGLSSYNFGNKTGLSTWKAYELKAETSFDGVSLSASKTHHITGLPYIANPPKNSDKEPNHPWTIGHDSSKYEWNNDHVKMSKDGVWDSPNIKSPGFYIPAVASNGINVYVTSVAQINGLDWWLGWQTTDYEASIGDSVVFSVNSGKQTGTVFGDDKLKGAGTFTKDNNILTCTSTYSSSGPNVMIYTVTINYN